MPGDSLVLAAFADGLRALRRQTGPLSYRALARGTHYSASTLSLAASGKSLPTRAVALAFVAGCGGDVAVWEQVWEQTAAALGRPVGVPARVRRERPARRSRPAGIGLLKRDLCALVQQVREHVTCARLGPSQAASARRRPRRAGSTRHLADVITAYRGPAARVSHVRVAGALAGRPPNITDEVLVLAIVQACHDLCAIPFTAADRAQWIRGIRSAAAVRQAAPATVRDVASGHIPSRRKSTTCP
ncbi:helix-turn-helix domain-containing protein [Streptomyces sp. NBC_00203]|uniref:helix-turn-helix domain-containing protein n=1 Tax=Streptomyces sp. NBC_00203 TaxID=2975680 RepID=UPI00324B5939